VGIAFGAFVLSGLATPLIANYGNLISAYLLPPKAPEPDLRVDVLSQDETKLTIAVKNYGDLASFVNLAVACPPHKGAVYKPGSWEHWDIDDRRLDFEISSLNVGHIRPYNVGCNIDGLGITLHVVGGDQHVPGNGESRILEFERSPNFRYFGYNESGPGWGSATGLSVR